MVISKRKFHSTTCHEDPGGEDRYSPISPLTSALFVEWMVNATPRPLNPGNDPVTVVEEYGWSPEPVWTGAEQHTPPGFYPGPSSK